MESVERLLVKPARLEGAVTLGGAKNSALRLLAASLLTSERVSLLNHPNQLLDARIHLDMLRVLGKSVDVVGADQVVISESTTLNACLVWNDRSIRNTLLILGALVTRFGEGRVPLPGGCQLGDRKYDLHVMLLEKLGARVFEEGGYLCASAGQGLKGADIHLPIRSTGATENAIIASCLAGGTTRIWNPHIRPEILDLVAMLRSMGAEIEVFGQEHVKVTGVEGLEGTEHRVIPDNMEAITWLIGAVMTGGEVEIQDFPYRDLEVVLAHLKAAGASIYRADDALLVRGGACYPVEISTGPHPGINSDVQPLLAAWGARARGQSRITDLRFPGRYGYAEEMARMGLRYDIVGDMLIIHGAGGKLSGAEVTALDLRAGAALTLCGLMADGETVINDAWQIFRGYDRFVEKLTGLGADVRAL